MKNKFEMHVSIDCVLIGFDGDKMNVLLVERTKLEDHPQQNVILKLPGRLVRSDEDPIDAAAEVLETMTGVKDTPMRQFKVFGDPARTHHSQDDVEWLKKLILMEAGFEMDVKRIVSIGYMTPVRISTRLKILSPDYNAIWVPVEELPQLAFDHKGIINDAMEFLKMAINASPEVLFRFLPSKFTILAFRKLYEVITGKEQDVRNFHKKVQSMPFIKPLNKWQRRVSHRAARYYTFDKKAYNRIYKQP